MSGRSPTGSPDEGPRRGTSNVENVDVIERLENWRYGHKARAVLIEIDNGYGASCWTVTLHHEKRPWGDKIQSWETSFTKGGTPMPYVVYACGQDDGTDGWEPFVGLAATINAGIDLFERLSTWGP